MSGRVFIVGAVLLRLVMGCAHVTTPYLSELTIGDWSGDWSGDGNPKVLVLHNPEPYAVHFDILCVSDVDQLPWQVDVPAKTDKTVLIQVLNRDEFRNDCSMTWTKLDHEPHGLMRGQGVVRIGKQKK